MPSNEILAPFSRTFRVLIIGGSYGGLAAALTLADLARGKTARFSYNLDAKAPQAHLPIQITVVDERDGYCMSHVIFRDENPYSPLRPPHRIPQSPGLRKVCSQSMDPVRRHSGTKGS